MNKITEYIKKNKKIALLISVGIVLGLIALILNIDNISTSISSKISNTTESNTKIIKEYDTIDKDTFERKTLDKITEHVISGTSGVYSIEGRNYIILTTGGNSASDIEYKIESTTDRKLNVSYNLSDNIDGENKIRFKIIEVDSLDVAVLKNRGYKDISIETGFKQLLIFKSNGDKKVYSIKDKHLIETDTWETDGAYMGSFKDGELLKCESISSITIEDCIVKEKVDSIYSIEIPSKDLIQVYIDNKSFSGLEIDSSIALRIKYDTIKQMFSGEKLEGYYVER